MTSYYHHCYGPNPRPHYLSPNWSPCFHLAPLQSILKIIAKWFCLRCRSDYIISGSNPPVLPVLPIIQFLQQFTRPYMIQLLIISLTSSATLTLAKSLQLQLPPCCSEKTPATLLSQGLCTHFLFPQPGRSLPGGQAVHTLTALWSAFQFLLLSEPSPGSTIWNCKP